MRVGIRVKRRTMCLHYVALCEVHVRDGAYVWCFFGSRTILQASCSIMHRTYIIIMRYTYEII